MTDPNDAAIEGYRTLGRAFAVMHTTMVEWGMRREDVTDIVCIVMSEMLVQRKPPEKKDTKE